MINTKTQTVKCDQCQSKFQKTNKKRTSLCENCTCIEKHGVTLFEYQRIKQREYAQKMQQRAIERNRQKPVKLSPRVNPISSKHKERQKALSLLKIKIKQEQIEGDFCKCAGCENYFDVIDASHKIPISRSEILSTDKNNITLLCRTCHNIYEHGRIEEKVKLKSFIADMRYIYDNDFVLFQKHYYRVYDAYQNLQLDYLKDCISKLEAFGG